MRWGPSLRSEIPDVASIVDATTAALMECFKNELVGIYLSGSLSMGDFDLNSSDIDFVVVLRRPLGDAAFLAALRETHNRLRTDGGWWGTRLEVVYLPVHFCRATSLERAQHWMLNTSGDLVLSKPRSDWIVQMYIAREYGPHLAGSTAAETIAEVTEDQLRASVHGAAPFIRRPEGDVQIERTLALHVLSACRLLYTKMLGTIATKSQAATWAENFFHGEWSAVIGSALATRGGRRLVPCASGYALVEEIEALLARD